MTEVIRRALSLYDQLTEELAKITPVWSCNISTKQERSKNNTGSLLLAEAVFGFPIKQGKAASLRADDKVTTD